MRKTKIVVALLVGLFPDSGRAADRSAADAPPSELRVLDSLVGTWAVEGKWQGADGKVQIKTGTSLNRWILGGRFLECDAVAERVGGRVESRILLGFDTREQSYFALIMDDQSSHYLRARGTYRASSRSFVLSGKERDEAAGRVYGYRFLLRLEGPDRYAIEVFFDIPGPAPLRLIEAAYARSAEPSPDREGARP